MIGVAVQCKCSAHSRSRTPELIPLRFDHLTTPFPQSQDSHRVGIHASPASLPTNAQSRDRHGRRIDASRYYHVICICQSMRELDVNPIATLPTAARDVWMYSPSTTEAAARANYRMHKMRQCDGREVRGFKKGRVEGGRRGAYPREDAPGGWEGGGGYAVRPPSTFELLGAGHRWSGRGTRSLPFVRMSTSFEARKLRAT